LSANNCVEVSIDENIGSESGSIVIDG